ncbi:hypothetical protein TrLO_g10368 [Triparma laevis f. longispina]|uniref:C3H1-type domain-containing protein n=1 Tax=Triparma laevis f. longispina TaxID=1714387 RepID=A0A9W6ZDW3_9STRA|nr:hypothetical protein TrLO_g10368 [Triparma laevis f. longispina]
MLFAWTIADSGRDWCASYFRSGVCDHKRCRFFHTDSGLTRSIVSDTQSESLPPLQKVPLETIKPGGKLVYDRNLRTQRREKSCMYFVEYGEELVYDFEDEGVFERWVEGVERVENVKVEVGEEEKKDSGIENVETNGVDGGSFSKKERRKLKRSNKKASNI